MGDGMGLKLKSFAIGQTYHTGEYLFSKSSKDNHDSMYIAKKSFVANKKPHLDLDSGNWVEFHAPRGVKGENGDRGLPGIAGEKGATGVQGAQGMKGDQGMKGNDGQKGERGERGATGMQGIQGMKGMQGNDGQKGEHGMKEIKVYKV